MKAIFHLRKGPIGAFVAILLMLVCAAAQAQEPIPQPPPPQDNPQASQSKTDSADQSGSGDSTSIDHPAVITSTVPQVRQVDAAGFVGLPVSPFRIGPLYLRYAQYAQVFSSGTTTSSTTGDFQNTASQFSAGIVFDKQFR